MLHLPRPIEKKKITIPACYKMRSRLKKNVAKHWANRTRINGGRKKKKRRKGRKRKRGTRKGERSKPPREKSRDKLDKSGGQIESSAACFKLRRTTRARTHTHTHGWRTRLANVKSRNRDKGREHENRGAWAAESIGLVRLASRLARLAVDRSQNAGPRFLVPIGQTADLNNA